MWIGSILVLRKVQSTGLYGGTTALVATTSSVVLAGGCGKNLVDWGDVTLHVYAIGITDRCSPLAHHLLRMLCSRPLAGCHARRRLAGQANAGKRPGWRGALCAVHCVCARSLTRACICAPPCNPRDACAHVRALHHFI